MLARVVAVGPEICPCVYCRLCGERSTAPILLVNATEKSLATLSTSQSVGGEHRHALAHVRRRGESGRGVGGCARAAERAGGWPRRSPTCPPRWADARRNHGPSLCNVQRRCCSLRACKSHGAFEGDADLSGLPTPASRARSFTHYQQAPWRLRRTTCPLSSAATSTLVSYTSLHWACGGAAPAAPGRA